jgi:hypothetical protein
MFKKKYNWASEAKRAVEYTADAMSLERLGVLPSYRPGVAVVFGNYDPDEPLSADHAVFGVRLCMKAAKVRELGFATQEDGRSWAVLARTSDLEIVVEFFQESSTRRIQAVRERILRAMEVRRTSTLRTYPD